MRWNGVYCGGISKIKRPEWGNGEKYIWALKISKG